MSMKSIRHHMVCPESSRVTLNKLRAAWKSSFSLSNEQAQSSEWIGCEEDYLASSLSLWRLRKLNITKPCMMGRERHQSFPSLSLLWIVTEQSKSWEESGAVHPRSPYVSLNIVNTSKSSRILFQCFIQGKSLEGAFSSSFRSPSQWFLGLSLNDRSILFVVILLDKTVSVG